MTKLKFNQFCSKLHKFLWEIWKSTWGRIPWVCPIKKQFQRYKFIMVQNLHPEDRERRTSFCRLYIEFIQHPYLHANLFSCFSKRATVQIWFQYLFFTFYLLQIQQGDQSSWFKWWILLLLTYFRKITKYWYFIPFMYPCLLCIFRLFSVLQISHKNKSSKNKITYGSCSDQRCLLNGVLRNFLL